MIPDKIRDGLMEQVMLSSLQAEVFMFITTSGRQTVQKLSSRFGIPESEALGVACSLVDAGALIDMSDVEFEAMHPRFAIVNMYRRMCEREKIEFKRNRAVDEMGAALEKSYDNARTK